MRSWWNFSDIMHHEKLNYTNKYYICINIILNIQTFKEDINEIYTELKIWQGIQWNF